MKKKQKHNSYLFQWLIELHIITIKLGFTPTQICTKIKNITDEIPAISAGINLGYHLQTAEITRKYRKKQKKIDR
jgi:hypothetical protein